MSEALIPNEPGAAGDRAPRLARLLRYANYAVELVVPMLPQVRLFGSGTTQTSIDGLTVRCDRVLPENPALLSAWEDLYRRVPNATPFQSPAWQRSLLETPQALRRLRLFTVYDGEKLIAVLPLESRMGKILRTSGAMLTDYLDPLIDPAYAQNCWPAILKGVGKLAPGRSVVLENIREESCGPALSASAAAAGFAISDSANHAVARIALPATWDAYLESLDRHERKELKRKLRKAEEQGGARLEICNDSRTVVDEINAMFDLLEGAGGGKARKAKWVFPRHFAASAPALAASGGLVLYKLIIENKHAAGLIALPTRQGQILWNTTFDPEMRQWSPGIVLFAMLIRRAIEEGHTTFDLLRGQYEYKYRLGAADHPLRTLTLRPAA
jgi:CelD/BcsL family acetyltransferase involved in cellulose biosynthesis